MNKLSTAFIKDVEFERWDSFVDESPAGTLFHKTLWLKASQLSFRILGCYQGEKLVGGVPLVLHRRLATTFIQNPPLTPYLGIVYGDHSGMKHVKSLSVEKRIGLALVERVVKEADVISTVFPPGNFDLHPFMWKGFTTGIRYTYLLDVTDIERVFGEMDAKRRSEIRKAMKQGLKVHHDAPLQDFIRLNRMTFKRQNAHLAVSSEQLENIHRILQENESSHFILVKDKEGVLHGGVYMVWDNKRAYYLMGGLNPEKGNTGGVPLAIWEAIRYTSNVLKLQEFDFEGSNIPGIEHSFRQYGGILTPYFTVYRARLPNRLILLSVDKIAALFRVFHDRVYNNKKTGNKKISL